MKNSNFSVSDTIQKIHRLLDSRTFIKATLAALIKTHDITPEQWKAGKIALLYKHAADIALDEEAYSQTIHMIETLEK